MIEPITEIGLILALIPLYNRERDKTKQANTEEFFKWLLEHNFSDIKDSIAKNQELTSEIEKLLRMNQDELLARLDELDKKLFTIMNSIEGLSNLAKILSPESELTEQEESILKQFDESGECNLIDMGTMEQPICWMAGRTEIQVEDARILNSNLSRLAKMGYLDEETSENGNRYYQITDKAIEYVDKLYCAGLSGEAISLLRRFVKSGESNFYLDTDKSPPCLQAGNRIMEIRNPKYLIDDMNSLEKKEFVKYVCEVAKGVKQYSLTRPGEDFIKERFG